MSMAVEPSPPRKASPSRIPTWVWVAIVLVALVALGVELLVVKRSPKADAPALPVLAQAPDFSFASQTGTPVTKADLVGKIWVADFIFTRCAGPCPLMTDRMRQLQAATENLDGGNVRLVSVSVDPAYDTPEVLARYAARYGANADRWSFLTGDPTKVENFITKGMLLGLSKDGQGLPVHSQKFAVVDRVGNIRAYHDLDNPALVPNLLKDIETLTRERQTPQNKP